jgi:CBS-domain-containing membrane protein
MGGTEREYEISDDDLRAALKEMKTYVDITEEDLGNIYRLALKHAKERYAINIPVKSIMTRTVVVVNWNAEIHEVARLLAEHRISGLPVVDDGNRLVGVITEADVLSLAGVKKNHTFKDIVRHILGEQTSVRKEGNKVSDFMTSPAITTTPDADITWTARILDEKRIKRLPVIDEAGSLIGIVSRGDIVRIIGEQ